MAEISKSRSLTCVIYAVIFATGALPVHAQHRHERPNFVIIMADDMGYSTASAYGGWIKTPALERMARDGMTFTDFHSSGAVCSPTRAGLVTGRYQERAGLPGVVYAAPSNPAHYTGLQDVEITFAEVLREAGYATALIGKWHLGYFPQYNPIRHGFDEFHGFVSGNVDYLSHYDNTTTYDWWDGANQVKEEGYTTHLITQHALNFIDTHKEEPFCLYVAHEAVHDPFQAPGSRIKRGPKKGQPIDAKELTQEEIYTQMMVEMDKGIDAVRDRLDKHGLANNTFVLFFSDNGPAKNSPRVNSGPLHGVKGSVWEGGHRVPAIACWPGKIKPGTVNHGLFISLDVMPTMLEFANIPTSTERPPDGISMSNALLHGETSKNRRLFWRGEAMREGPWKLMAGKDRGLFNLDEDLSELKDLSARYPERVRSMTAALEAWKTEMQQTATPQPGMPQQPHISSIVLP